jgi:hypothetical protein
VIAVPGALLPFPTKVQVTALEVRPYSKLGPAVLVRLIS